MTSKLAFIAILALAISCCDDEEGPLTCGYENPVNDLPWLKAKADEINNSEFSRRYFYIEKGEYNGETVFFVNSCCPLCDIAIIFYNCAGERVDPVSFSDVKNWERIWAPKELECLFND